MHNLGVMQYKDSILIDEGYSVPDASHPMMADFWVEPHLYSLIWPAFLITL